MTAASWDRIQGVAVGRFGWGPFVERAADGSVYRIRVVATDSCGLQSFSDCYVSVPRSKPGPRSAINRGQAFNATQFN